MMGATPHQTTWKVLVPAATPTLMVGVNQVTMLTLSMVIITSTIGVGALGFEVLASLRKLDIGGGFEAALAIVVIAIALDRTSQAFSERRMLHQRTGNLMQSHHWSPTVFLVTVATFVLGLVVPAMQSCPDARKISTGAFWSNAMEWIASCTSCRTIINGG